LQPLRTEAVVSEAEPEESLGPIEPPYPSPRFKRNYTVFLTQVCYLLSHIYSSSFAVQLHRVNWSHVTVDIQEIL